jgi:hypothetical protein
VRLERPSPDAGIRGNRRRYESGDPIGAWADPTDLAERDRRRVARNRLLNQRLVAFETRPLVLADRRVEQRIEPAVAES